MTVTRPRQNPALEALRRAPIDDEPFTEADRLAVSEALEDVRRGDVSILVREVVR